MRAAMFHGIGKPLAIETVADPTPGPDDVVIEVAHAGICGSDLHITQFGLIAEGTILGHEFAGTIAAKGAHVGANWKNGDRVTALPLTSCRACALCDEGLYALCANVKFIGTTTLLQGAYANYVLAKAASLQKLPAGISFAEGAMVEPLSVAHHTVDLAQIRPGETALVLGAGPIGAGVTLFARHAGAKHVIVSEPFPSRRARALELGATAVLDPKTDNIAERVAQIAGQAPNIVFECVGAPGLLKQAIGFAGPRARVVVAGVLFEEERYDPLVALGKELSIQYCQCYTERDFSSVINAIASNRVKPQPMHTATVGFSELPQSFEALRTASPHCKVLIDPARSN